MLSFTIRRILLAIPVLVLVALVIFLLLDLAPGDPMADQPPTLPPEAREEMRRALGLDQPAWVRFGLWLWRVVVIEPQVAIDHLFGTAYSAGEARVISWQFGTPVMDEILERLPRTLWVVGSAYVLGVLIAVPVGIVSAVRRHSLPDRIGTSARAGFSVPMFFAGVLLIVVASMNLGWFPRIHEGRLVVDDGASLQLRQVALPVLVLALFSAAQISRCMRASMLDNLGQDYVRTARAKGMDERVVVLRHVLRNSLIPVVSVIALGVPAVFGGAIIAEQVFEVDGLGRLLIAALHAGDLPMVQTLTLVFAVLIVLVRLIADVLYALLDPRVRHV